ncbi:hypothetical protein [Protofrankia sp. BMG5.30]|nr:hypothetical protein [Protofrankia sp. BMG5.30]ONH34497.1 hypothetical protein BL254_15705 [Protofrankia sp. BMG5.30]
MPGSSDVGFDAGWRLDFRAAPAAAGSRPPVSVDRSGYDAEIQVAFESTWSAPTFTVTVDGMSQQDVDAILGGPYPEVEIALGWRDTPGSFLSAGASVLAAVGLGPARTSTLTTVLAGRITALERTAGDVRYRTRFSGVDSTWARLRRSFVSGTPLPAQGTVVDWLRALLGSLTPAVTVVAEGNHPTIDGRTELRAGDRIADAVQALARGAFPDAPHGRIPVLLRDGTVHVGTWTTRLTGANSHPLDTATGLVDATPAPYEHDDPARDDPFATSTADAWDVMLLGRPDIKVGDAVTIRLPEVVKKKAAAGLADSVVGAIGGAAALAAPIVGLLAPPTQAKPRDFRVVSVTHTLGRTTGFTTKLRVEGVGAAAKQPGPTAEAHRVAETIDARIGTMARSRRAVDAGIVTAQSVAASERRHAQRLDLDDGLAQAAPPNVAVRGRLDSPATRLTDKPYVTPFAYGGTGLVVPHYPGTRVVQLNHDGDPRNAVVAGCVWDEGTEPSSQAGDWWLTLPTNVAPATDGDDVTPAPDGRVASDLVDARGARVVNVLGFELTVGEDSMPNVGKRPDTPAAGVLTVKTKKGNASISIDADGNITISTDKEIRLNGEKVVMTVKSGVEVNKGTA